MSLIVEDGTGVVGAESYATEAQATAYFSNRGVAAWTAVENKEAALRKATDYMVQNYRLAWKGCRVDPEQALDWPRSGCYVSGYLLGKFSSDYLIPSNVVPNEVRNACIELALKASSEDLNSDLTQQVLSEKVGPLAVTYSEHSPQYKRFRAVDMSLRHLLVGNTVTHQVLRS